MPNVKLVQVANRIYRSYNDSSYGISRQLHVKVEEEEEQQQQQQQQQQTTTSFDYSHVLDEFEPPLGFVDRPLQKHIERELGVRLQWDKKTPNQVVVHAPDADHLQGRMVRLRRLLNLSRSYTHFIGIPLNTPELVLQMQNVVIPELTRILSQSPTSRFHDSIFVSPKKFHLTLCMLRLHDEEHVALVQRIMREKVAPKMTEMFREMDSRSLRMSSLSSFQLKNPQKTRVVYFDAEEGLAREKVHELVNLIRDELLADDLITPQEHKEDWKMHSTIMNVKYRREIGRRKRDRRDHFDATELFAKYAPDAPCDLLNAVPLALKTLEVSSLKLDEETGYYICDHREDFPE